MKLSKVALSLGMGLALAAPAWAGRPLPAPAPKTDPLPAPVAPAGLTVAERESLRVAQQASTPELSELRAGDVSDSDLHVITIVILVVVALIIIF